MFMLRTMFAAGGPVIHLFIRLAFSYLYYIIISYTHTHTHTSAQLVILSPLLFHSTAFSFTIVIIIIIYILKHPPIVFSSCAAAHSGVLLFYFRRLCIVAVNDANATTCIYIRIYIYIRTRAHFPRVTWRTHTHTRAWQGIVCRESWFIVVARLSIGFMYFYFVFFLFSSPSSFRVANTVFETPFRIMRRRLWRRTRVKYYIRPPIYV